MVSGRSSERLENWGTAPDGTPKIGSGPVIRRVATWLRTASPPASQHDRPRAPVGRNTTRPDTMFNLLRRVSMGWLPRNDRPAPDDGTSPVPLSIMR
jgi:hypothetical protein